MTVEPATVEMLARHWEDGWNHADLDMIMAPFASDVLFGSPGIALMTRDPSRTTIEGYDALRDYIANALRMTPGVRYTLRATHVGTESIVLVYGCGLPDRPEKIGADLMRVNGAGKVAEWRCHF